MLFEERPAGSLIPPGIGLRTTKKQQEDAFMLIYDTYSPGLYAYILKIVRDEVKGGEILFLLFLKAYDNAGTPLPSTLFMWLHNTARNEAIEVLIDMYFVAKLALPGGGKTMVDTMALQCFILELPLLEKTVLSLVYIRSYTVEETAEFLKLPVCLVKSKMEVAKLKFYKLYPAFSFST